MTVSTHDHIHIDTDNPPTTTYYVQHGTLDMAQDVAVAHERSITGLLHVHRIENGVTAGVPVQFDSDDETLLLRGTTVMADLATLQALAGRQVYWTRNYHDDDEDGAGSLEEYPTSSYVKRGILMIRTGGVKNLDPCLTFFTVQIEFVDSGTVTS